MKNPTIKALVEMQKEIEEAIYSERFRCQHNHTKTTSSMGCEHTVHCEDCGAFLGGYAGPSDPPSEEEIDGWRQKPQFIEIFERTTHDG